MRDFILRHVAREADSQYVLALQAYHRGDLDRVVALAAQAALAEPDNPRPAVDLAKLLMLQRRYARADGLLRALPDNIR